MRPCIDRCSRDFVVLLQTAADNVFRESDLTMRAKLVDAPAAQAKTKPPWYLLNAAPAVSDNVFRER